MAGAKNGPWTKTGTEVGTAAGAKTGTEYELGQKWF